MAKNVTFRRVPSWQRVLSSLWTLRQAPGSKLRNYRSFPLTKQLAPLPCLHTFHQWVALHAAHAAVHGGRRCHDGRHHLGDRLMDQNPVESFGFTPSQVIAGTLDPKYGILEVLIHSHIMFSHIHYAKTLQNQAWQCENSPFVDYWWLILENCEVCATCCVLFKSQLFWFNHLACCITMFHVHVSGEITVFHVKCCWVEKTTGKGRSC